jgi:hypothetical protein
MRTKCEPWNLRASDPNLANGEHPYPDVSAQSNAGDAWVQLVAWFGEDAEWRQLTACFRGADGGPGGLPVR